MKEPKRELSQQDENRIMSRAQEIFEDQAKVKDMNKELADMYWISETEDTPGNSRRIPRYNHDAFDISDVRVTATTSSRDRVTGLHRLLRTTKPQFSVECKVQTYADKIEKALEKWWDANNEKGRATIESELALSGILFSDENLNVTSLDDMIEATDQPIRKRRLQELRKRTPMKFDVESPLYAYPVLDDLGKSEHLSITQMKGRRLREMWGVECKDDQDYNLCDYMDLEDVCTWYNDGQAISSASGHVLRSGKHGLIDIPRFTSITDGTDLFPEEERKRQPFLYGFWKSGLHKREDELLTSLFTSVFARGHGPLIIIDKDAPGYEDEIIQVQHAGLVRYLAAHGRPQLADDKAFDANLIQLSNMLQAVGERTTIASQTLGENIESGTPYSGYALASQNGRIPIIPIQEATEKVIHDACVYALRYFKEQGMEWEGLKPGDILDDFELTVKLEVDLPQDQIRTAQAVTQLKTSGLPLSNEYLHNLLQIKDSEQMTFDVMAEVAAQEAYKQGLPGLVQEMMAMLTAGTSAPNVQGGGGNGQVSPEAVPSGEYPVQPGMEGGEVMPATEPMPPGANNGRA